MGYRGLCFRREIIVFCQLADVVILVNFAVKQADAFVQAVVTACFLTVFIGFQRDFAVCDIASYGF